MLKHSLIMNLLSATLMIQAPAQGPLRLGGGAQQLSQSDIASIESLLPGNTKPWLYGDIAQTAQTSAPVLGAFLPPTTQTPELRRGNLITLRWPDNSPSSSGWTIIDANGSYAQVAVAGLNFDQIQGNQTTNRPFRVQGTIDDADLLEIINAARGKSFGTLVLNVERNASNQIIVSLGLGNLYLEKKGQEWIVVQREPIKPGGGGVTEPRLPQRLTPPRIILGHVESAPQ